MHILLTSDVSQKRQNRETKCRTSDEYVILLHKQLLLYRIYAKKVLLDGTNTRLYRNKHQPLLRQTPVSVVLNTSLRHIKHQSPSHQTPVSYEKKPFPYYIQSHFPIIRVVRISLSTIHSTRYSFSFSKFRPLLPWPGNKPFSQRRKYNLSLCPLTITVCSRTCISSN